MAASLNTPMQNTGIDKIDAILDFIRNVQGGNILNLSVRHNYRGLSTISLEFVLVEDQELLRYVPEEAMGHNREVCACHNCLEFRANRVHRIREIERMAALGAPLTAAIEQEMHREAIRTAAESIKMIPPLPEPNPVRRIVTLEE